MKKKIHDIIQAPVIVLFVLGVAFALLEMLKISVVIIVLWGFCFAISILTAEPPSGRGGLNNGTPPI